MREKSPAIFIRDLKKEERKWLEDNSKWDGPPKGIVLSAEVTRSLEYPPCVHIQFSEKGIVFLSDSYGYELHYFEDNSALIANFSLYNSIKDNFEFSPMGCFEKIKFVNGLQFAVEIIVQ